MANAGRVAIVPKGEYSATVAYKRLDLVRYNNDLYIAKKANTGVLPTETATWMLCMENVTQSQYDDLISGAVKVGNSKEADNSKLLEGHTAKEVGASGVRNLIPYPYYQSTKTESGIVWTDNGDGTVNANGTSTAACQYVISNALILPAGTYTLSGCPSNGTWGTYHIRLVNASDGSNVAHDAGTTKTFTLTETTTLKIWLVIASGLTVDFTFRPMLERGSVAHDWVPYHSGGAEHALDADTVDGYHASKFVRNAQGYGWKSYNFVSMDINTWIKDGVYAYSTDCTNKPHGNYGTIFVMAPDASKIYQIGYDWNEDNQPLRLRGSNDGGTTWSEWRYLGQGVFLPLDGSVPMSGNLEVDKGTSYSHILVKRTQSDGSTYGAYEYIGTDKSVTFALKDVGSNTTKANFTLKEGGATIDNNTILHTGNSQKVVTSASAPSDTSALWVDTTNKKVKAYIDGAWTAMA